MLVSPEIGFVFTGSMDVNWTNSHDVPTNASMNADVEKKNGRKNKYFLWECRDKKKGCKCSKGESRKWNERTMLAKQMADERGGQREALTAAPWFWAVIFFVTTDVLLIFGL